MFKYLKTISIALLLTMAAVYVSGSTGSEVQSADSTTAVGVSTQSVAESVDENATEIVLTNQSEPAVAEVPTEATITSIEAFKQTPEFIKFMIDNLWILVCAAMVFIMHLGFATVESGFTQAKNSVNVIYKNLFILAVGIITYALVGFQLMYPGDFNGFFGFGGFGIGYDPSDPVGMLTPSYGLDMTIWTDFIFQAMFAATAATIVSGCVTGRVKLPAFMIFGTLLVAVSYPITGSWLWGGGWLSELGFHDFAGSTLVHAVGGVAGLACVLLLGPRAGKFENGEIKTIPGHNIPLATVGIFLLWFGWFGFNGGSVLSADPAQISFVFVNTALAAAAGALASMAATNFFMHKLDAPMALNGILAGLVGITAGANVVSPNAAILIGAISGVLVVGAVLAIDRLRIDDPVGAISVHGVCGVFGTLAVGIFSPAHSFVTQLIGTSAVVGFTLVFSFLVFGAIKYTMGVRVDSAVEHEGLDMEEHGNNAYPSFAGIELVPQRVK
jgi:Amt family ammonium transporter